MKLALHENLRILRKRNGYTQKEVADALKLERSTYAYYETGKTQPKINTLIEICKMYRCKSDELLGFKH